MLKTVKWLLRKIGLQFKGDVTKLLKSFYFTPSRFSTMIQSLQTAICGETLPAANVRADFPEQVTKAKRPDFSENEPFINNEFASLIRSEKEIRQRLLSPRAVVLCAGTTLASLITSSASSLSENDVVHVCCPSWVFPPLRWQYLLWSLISAAWRGLTCNLYKRFHTLTPVNIQRIRSEQCPLSAQGNICVARARGGGAWCKKGTFSPISCRLMASFALSLTFSIPVVVFVRPHSPFFFFANDD